MKAYASEFFNLGIRDHTGTSALERTRSGIEQRGARGEAWAAKNGLYLTPQTEIAPCMAEVFSWFCDMGRGRGEGFSGPAKMTWETIHYWRREKRMRRLIDFEFDCLFELDDLYRTIVAEKQKKLGEGGQT